MVLLPGLQSFGIVSKADKHDRKLLLRFGPLRPIADLIYVCSHQLTLAETQRCIPLSRLLLHCI